MNITRTTTITKDKLRNAQPDALIRLAKYLRLKTNDMSTRQTANLIYWRLTREMVY
jgi:hypothetical protein